MFSIHNTSLERQATRNIKHLIYEVQTASSDVTFQQLCATPLLGHSE